LCIAVSGQSRVGTAPNDRIKAEISVHNKTVQRNTNILTRLVNAVCFFGKQELVFRGHEELKNSINCGDDVQLLKYTAEYDPVVAEHTEDPLY
jgi:exoribonuclease II